MRTEARRKYLSGFELTEQELRRIHDVADQQMKRILPDGGYETAYEVRYQNGAIAEPGTLNEIFEQENLGSTSIRLVALNFRDNAESPRTKINVTFADSGAMDSDKSISYEIEGEDRDWVFVASSQLSERIARVERFNLLRILKSTFLPPVLVMLMMLSMLASLALVKDPTSQTSLDRLEILRQSWKDGELRDPVEALLRIEEGRLRTNSEVSLKSLMFPAFIPMIAAVLVLPGLWLAARGLLKYGFPPYNFVWGEYEAKYEKKKGRRRFVFVGVILALALGVLANLLSRKLGW